MTSRRLTADSFKDEGVADEAAHGANAQEIFSSGHSGSGALPGGRSSGGGVSGPDGNGIKIESGGLQAGGSAQGLGAHAGQPVKRPPPIPHPITAQLALEIGINHLEERPAYDEFVTQLAKKTSKDVSRRSAAPFAGEKRNKTQWDHLLEEMEWLAKDFSRERKWKLTQCKRFATAISRSNLDIEGRLVQRERQETETIRKKASWVAKQVSLFWGKAARVKHTKYVVAIEAKKKEVLDKNLDLILGKTEQYSKMLAANLQILDESEPSRATPAPGPPSSRATPAPSAAATAAAKKVVRFKEEDGGDGGAAAVPAASGGGEGDEGGDDEEDEDDATFAGLLKRPRDGDGSGGSGSGGSGDGEHDDVAVDDAGEASGAAAGPSSPRPRRRAGGRRGRPAKRARAAGPAAGDDEEEAGDEYNVGGSNSEDDERTLEEEDAIGARDRAAARREEEEELAGLDEEAEMSIEELMARYGYVTKTADDEVVVDAEVERLASGKAAAERGSPPPAAAGGGGDGAPGLVPEEDLHAGDEEDEEGAGAGSEAGTSAAATAGGSGGGTEPAPEASASASAAGATPVSAAAAAGASAGGDAAAAAAASPADAAAAAAAGTAAAATATAAAAAAGAAEDGDDAGKAGDEGGKADDAATFEAAALDAISAQPTGHTLSTTQVITKVPFLLKHTMREYQHIGLDWLATMYQRKLNGILADEMGLGKTIQAIALLAWLACEEGSWGPHLIVVPTSVMINWEMEFKKWCPAFKLLTYYGSAKERKAKRLGWSKPNAFHVCITSYTIVLQDAKMFRRKKWKYLILDEAHMIKNWKSQRWQTLLRFNSKRRLLITGTPLQNDLMELWSLMHFLMPSVFASHDQFRDWFCNPLTGMVEGSEAYNKQLVERLHGVLRPFLLRRTKAEVEKQMPKKHEHVIRCRLSKRQRLLYDEYMAATEVQDTLNGGSFLGIINVLMQLRKVCNHPDLFEGRAIVSAYDMEPLAVQVPSLALAQGLLVPPPPLECANLSEAGLLWNVGAGRGLAVWEAAAIDARQVTFQQMQQACGAPRYPPDETDPDPVMRAAAAAAGAGGAPGGMGPDAVVRANYGAVLSGSPVAMRVLAESLAAQAAKRVAWRTSRLRLLAEANARRCSAPPPMLGPDTLALLRGAMGVHSCSRALAPERVWVRELDPASAASSADAGAAEGAAGAAGGGAGAAVAAGAAGGGGTSTSSGCGPRGDPELSGMVRWRPPGADGIAGARTGARLPRAAAAVYARGALSELALEVGASYASQADAVDDMLRAFMMYIPKARAIQAPAVWCSHPDTSMVVAAREAAFTARQAWFEGSAPLRTATVRSQLFFPDRKLLQYDCGKLQEMAGLLRRLKSGGHRCLIFTQMSKMLDLLEAFLNLHGHTYMRLDGSTKPEQRQILMQRFNTDPKVFCFILSTRSGGVGINLIGADTVIFYDSDWNPAMDAQAQDRCHRIGQTREVHIYRLVSDNTIEENILAKSDQKRQLDWLAIQSAGFTTDMLSKFNVRDFFGNATAGSIESGPSAEEVRAAMRGAEDEDDAHAAIELEKEQEQEDEEFTTEVPAGAKEDGGEEAGEAGDEDDEDGNAQDATQDADGKPKGAKKGAAAAAAATGAAGKSVSRSRSPGGGAGGDDEPDGGQPAEDEDDGGGGALVAAAAAGGGDILANIDAKLKPIEKYAVRLLEEWYPEDFDAAAAVIDKGLDENAWDVDEMARRKEEQEEECEDSEGDELVEEWDKATATEAYREYATMIKEQIQQAEAEMEKYMAAEAEAAARATAAAAAAAQQAASGWDDVYVGGAGGGRVKAEPGEPGSSGVGGIMMVKPEEDVYYLGTRRPPGLASHAFTQSHESDAGRPRAEALCGSWLGQQAAVRPAVGAQRLLLPWPTSWDAALCGAVLKAVAKLAQQVPLSEVAWHSVAEAVASDAVSSALSGAAQQRGGNSQKHPPMLALAMATPERCAARYTQLHVALLAAHGILPPNALVGSVTERLAAVLYSLPPTEREAAIARMRLPAADAKGSKFADGLADGGGSAPPRGVGDLADRMGEQLGAVLALVAAREGAGHGAPPPPRALDLAQLGVSAFDAEQLVAAVAEVDARRAQAAASARSQQAAAARGVQRTQLDSSTQALRSTSGGAGGGAGSSGGSGGGGGGGGGGGFKIKIGGVHLGVVGGAGATPLSTPLTGASSGSAGGGGKPPLSSGGAKGGGKAKCAGGGSQGSQPGQPRTASLNDAGADALSAHQQYAAGTPPAMPGDGGLGLGLRLGLGTPPHGLWGASAPNGGGGGAGPSPLGLGGASGEDAEPTPPPLMSAAAAEWQQQQQQMMMMQAQYGGLGGFGAPSGSGQYGGMGMGGMPAYPGMMPGQGPDAMQQHMAAMHMQQMQMQHMHMHMAPMQQAQHASLGGFGQPSQQHMALGGFGAPAPMQQQQVSLGGFGAPAPAPLGGFGVPPPQQQQQQHQLGGFGPPGPNNNLGFG